MSNNLMKSIVVFALFCGTAYSLTSMNTFDKLIRSRCYNRTGSRMDEYLLNGQRIPLSSSMETFIGLLESFEANYTKLSPSDVAETFLRRFRIDGVTRVKSPTQRDYTFVPDSLHEDRRMVIESILFSKTNIVEQLFPEEAFTEEEKCALYFMMSHTFTKCSTDDNNPSPEKCDLEKGVVSLHNNEVHAIAPGRVLLGILAGLRNMKKVSIAEILADSPHIINGIDDKRKQYLNEMIDPIYAVTVGDVVVQEIRRVETKVEKRKFGPNGKWNSTICPTRYTLDSDEPTRATYAELRGAGDGVLLGLRAKEMLLNNQKIKISNLLRMYYSEHGIKLQGSASRYRYCDRYNHWTEIDKEIRQEILNYARLLDVRSTVSSDEIRLEEEVQKAMASFEQSRRDIVDIVDDSRCNEYDNNPCEKQSDIFVVMDTREYESKTGIEQKKIISELITYLDIRLHGGSATVMSLSRGYGDRQLEYVVQNTTLKGCVGCFADWVNPQGAAEDETYVFQSINKTLTIFKKEKEMHPGTPNQILIYFNYAASSPTSNRQLKDALWEVHNMHRDVPVYAIGGSDELLKMFATDDNNVLITGESTAKVLKQSMCETFSIFQHPYCWDRKSTLEDAAYVGYVTESYTQYWAMYPEYFLKSFDIKFTFSSENGQITVCYSRDKRKDRLQKSCKDTTGTDKDRTVQFTMSNPCKGKNVYNCNPFYFSIKGKELDANAKLCTNDECKYYDQIKFTVRHEGVSCNSSSCLMSSLKILFALLVIFYITRKNI